MKYFKPIIRSAVLSLLSAGVVLALGWPQAAGAQTPRPAKVGIERAGELPATGPAAIGRFVRREGNNLFIETMQKSDGGLNLSTVEVATSADTLIYRDVTTAKPLPADGKVQQTVAPGSLDELDERSVVSVWGERQDNRLVAQVLLYFKKPAQTGDGSLERAKELPDSKPNAVGVLGQREDNRLVLNPGKAGATPGNPQAVEVVVSSETAIYEDVTEFPADGPPADGKIQQVVVPGSLDKLTAGSFVMAWGDLQNGQTTARVLVYRDPAEGK